MNNEDKSKADINELINDFRNNYQNYKKLAESDVETKLVEELFIKVLGWDKKDFIKQEKVRRGEKSGRADYAFYIGDRIVFFLEAKKVGIPLEKEADKQVISYALSRKVPLAISTNFEQMNIFCVEQENALKNVFRTFRTPEDYINNFTDLWFLSKESFEQGLLLKKAEDEGRLKRRISIDKPLLEDFMRIRSLIANDIEKNYPTKYNINEKDEIIQRIIDRLIFIRRSEDVGINPDNSTLEEIKHLPGDKAYPRLKHIFSKYDDKYNSGLFTPNKDNDCDKITIDGEIIKKLIYYLYESHNKEYVYNFEWIDADILGQVYEQYLGKILAQTKSGKAKLKEGQAHRKEQGIYYTPPYVVDYIVKNTVCELLKDKKVDANKIKILDPACGSGSFLIKAFDYMQKHFSNGEEAAQHRLDSQGVYSIKTEILKNNIFGVDLDNKAVEITKLNLLLKAAEKFRKLPKELDTHICWGNSLIEDESFPHAFKWEGDFQEGTFDVVIGNPPYIRPHNIPINDKSFLWKHYKTSSNKTDIYAYFFERGLSLLRDNGRMGLITSNTYFSLESFRKLRKLILDQCCIETIVSKIPSDAFDATVTTSIIILRKENNESIRKRNLINYVEVTENDYTFLLIKEIPQIFFISDNNHAFTVSWSKEYSILTEKISENTKSLGELFEVRNGLATGDDPAFIKNKKESSIDKKVIYGEDIKRYNIEYKNRFVHYDPSMMKKHRKTARPASKDWFEIDEKIVIHQVGGAKIKACLDIDSYYATISTILIKRLNNFLNLKYLLSIINSKLIAYWYKKQSVTSTVKVSEIRRMPIKISTPERQQPFIKLVDRMLSLNKQLQEIGDKKTAQTAKLDEEIRKTDKEIDELVYKLYNVTEAEKKIIEESVK